MLSLRMAHLLGTMLHALADLGVPSGLLSIGGEGTRVAEAGVLQGMALDVAGVLCSSQHALHPGAPAAQRAVDDVPCTDDVRLIECVFVGVSVCCSLPHISLLPYCLCTVSINFSPITTTKSCCMFHSHMCVPGICVAGRCVAKRAKAGCKRCCGAATADCTGRVTTRSCHACSGGGALVCTVGSGGVHAGYAASVCLCSSSPSQSRCSWIIITLRVTSCCTLNRRQYAYMS